MGGGAWRQYFLTEDIKSLKLVMDRQPIDHKTEVKYLGVTLDSKLTWKPHISNKLSAAKGQLIRLLSEMHGTFGTKPKLETSYQQ